MISRILPGLTPRTMRGKIIVYSSLILLITASATFYTGLASVALARSVEILFRNNIFMKELRDELSATEANLTVYLTTKSTDSLKEYIMHSTRLSDASGRLNRDIRGDESLLLQRSLSGLLQRYLRVTEACVSAKRGRDIQGYTGKFETAARLASHARYLVSKSEEIFITDSLRSFSSFQSRIPLVLFSNAVLLLAANLMGFLLIVRYAYRLTEPLSRLAEAAKAVGRGEYGHELPAARSGDEIGTTTNAFASMQKSVQNAFEQLKSKAELENSLLEEHLQNMAMEHKLKDAELLALQTQINPHFLFNTLTAGMTLALTENAEKTGDFLENLAAFIRYALKLPSRSVFLSEELECVERSVWLMRLRFGDRYRFEIYADPALAGIETPALILQPLVENALGHGLKNRESGGWVAIGAETAGDEAMLWVEDNGEGMEPEEIRRLLGEQKSDGQYAPGSNANAAAQTGGEGIGLRNVIRRVWLSTGGKGRVEIGIGRERGTKVTIFLPLGGYKP